MNNSLLFKSLILVLFCLIGCKGTPKQRGITKAGLSQIICNCTSPVVNFNVELQAIAERNEMDQLASKMGAGEQIMKVAVDCVLEKIDEKAKSLVDDELTKLIADQCKLDVRMTSDFLEKINSYSFPSY